MSALATSGTISVATGTATVATPAAANWAAGGTTVALSVLGADAGGQAYLTYTWSATGPASVAYSVNGTNAAQNSIATVTVAGSYTFTATITDAQGPSTTSSVTITVGQTVANIVITPVSTSLSSHATQQYTAIGHDQFGDVMSPEPAYTWNVASGVGSISTSGLYTASYAAGSATVTAAYNGVTSNTASIIVTDAAPTVATAAAAIPSTITGTTTALSVLGADTDGGGESNLTYTWSVTAEPNGSTTPTFSPNATNAAKSTTATFFQAGNYTFLATITDGGGLSTTSSVGVTVNQTMTTIVVSPASAVLLTGATQNYTAVASDQFGAAMSVAPTFTWSSNVGSVNASGVFTAQSTSATGTVTATVGSVQGSAPVRVDALPVANADSYAALASSTLSVAAPGVLANDSGSSGTAITAVLVSNPSNGQLSLASNGSFQYTPTTGYTGSDSFSYKVYDGYFYSSPTTVTLSVAWPTWTGLGGDNHWSTAANWANSLAPQAGDELIFTGSTQSTSVNDYAAGTQFSSISIQSGNFTLQGNQVDLSSTSASITSVGSNNSISLPIDLLVATTISTSSGALTMGSINNGGYLLTVNAASGTTVNLSGAVQGSGGLKFTGAGAVNASAADTQGGTTTVASGKFIINSASSFPVGGSLVIGTPSSPGAVFTLASSLTPSAIAANSTAVSTAPAIVVSAAQPALVMVPSATQTPIVSSAPASTSTAIAPPSPSAASSASFVPLKTVVAYQPTATRESSAPSRVSSGNPLHITSKSVAIGIAPVRPMGVPMPSADLSSNGNPLKSRQLTAAAVDAVMSGM